MADPQPPLTALGVDIGGTFTDFILAEGVGGSQSSPLRLLKLPSTPDDPSRAFAQGMAELAVAAPERLVHGTTVATNAVLERKGAVTAFITTAGFRDMLEIGRQTRSGLYALTPTKPAPLVPRERCFEVSERVDRHGAVLTPLDEAGAAAALDAARAAGAESVAVVLLFSFARPEHEQCVGALAAERGLSVSLSSAILPQYREYERASTTVINAYVSPVMSRYLSRLETELPEAARGRLQVMQSNGGVISVPVARREAVRTILSGPAGGVVGAAQVAAAAGYRRIVTFDMGGTSTDVALVDGAPRTGAEGEIDGLPVRVPMLGIHTVGSGGGSISRVDAGGGLRVGPQSAGADPGPAAYGKGEAVTVTDANLVLGRLYPPSFLGGRMALDAERARRFVAALGARLGMDAEATAVGILRIVNVQMARAIRRVSVERGHDVREYCLVAFGGGGPLHACALAEQTGMQTVLVPRYPGALSAFGLLLSDVEKEYSRTVMLSGEPLPDEAAVLAARFAEMEATALADLAAEGIPAGQTTLTRWLDVRYRGQSYEITVPAGTGLPHTKRGLGAGGFDEAHHATYGYADPAAPIEIVHARLRATGQVPHPALPRAALVPTAAPAPMAGRPIHFDAATETSLYRRSDLTPGCALAGPALIVQEDTTTLLPPGWRARVDAWSNLILERS